MIDVTLLQIMKHRKDYLRLIKLVNERALDAKTTAVLKDFGTYFDKVDGCETIPLTGEFVTFFSLQHPKIAQEDMAPWRALLKQAGAEPNEMARDMLVAKLLEADMAVQLADIAERWQRGEEIDLPKLARRTVDDFDGQVQRRVVLPFVPVDGDLFEDEQHHRGFTWRWQCLNEHMRPLTGGDFLIMAGRPDQGKTTALTDNLTHMADQIDEFYPGEDRDIIWFNNEGPGKRIVKRLIQSALGLPMSRIIKLQTEGRLWSEYEKALGTRRNRIKVMDVHGFKAWQIEEILRQCPTAIVVFDMIDNVKFDGEVLNGGTRTDQMLEAMYQWGRELAVKHNCVVIATSQISNDGDGQAYPTLPMLKDSKTGKQGAADAIITIGSKIGPGYEDLRFIGCTKNKLQIEGMPKSPRAELYLDGPAGRYRTAVAMADIIEQKAEAAAKRAATTEPQAPPEPEPEQQQTADDPLGGIA